jgi:hypothetical protein
MAPALRALPSPADLTFAMHMTSRILDAVADRFLVNIQSDAVHVVSEEPPRLFSESGAAEFSSL